MDPSRRREFQAKWQAWQEQCDSRWRGRREALEGRPAKDASQDLEKVLSKLGIQERLLEDQMIEAWGEVVGPAVAHNTRPVQIKRGELVVAVTQPALKYDLERFHRGEILRRLQEQFGTATIRSLRFRVGN
tara:strand:+ start:10369 stop:10761 length:393 start_codon:yes stop_codon:yes gene_type:complete